ncbi:MAG: hypothetical protein ACJAT1_002230 [Marivirga sp.]|jgi:hypothetical protein
MGFIKHIAGEDRGIIYLKVLEWIIQRPNFILSINDKNELLTKLFNTKFPTTQNISTTFNTEKGYLLIKTESQDFLLLGLKDYISSTQYYSEFIDNGGKLGILYDYFAYERMDFTATYQISYKKVANVLSQVSIKDSKSQYFIDDFIEAIENR